MPIIANTTSGNTFSAIRAQLNSVTKRMNQFAINESAFYANTLTANVRFVSSGSTRLGTTDSNRTIINGLLSANGNLSLSGNTTIGGAGKVANATGWFGVAGRQSISTNLFVGGNTALTGLVNINYTGSANSSLAIRGTNTKGGTGYHDFLVVRNGGGGVTNPNKWFRTNSTGNLEVINNAYTIVLFSLSDVGDLVTSGNVTAYSDEKLKTNITTIEGALALVEQMRGVRYDRIQDGKAGIGVVAQEMQQVLPEVVLEGDNLSVAYGNLVGVLIEAVKELSARVKELEAK